MEERKHPTALEMLENKFDRQRPALEDCWGFLVGSVMGFAGVTFGNIGMQRPPLAGIQRHIGLALFMGALGQYARLWTRTWYAERDAMYRDYIRLHPDDFIMPEPRKVGELLEDWFPTR